MRKSYTENQNTGDGDEKMRTISLTKEQREKGMISDSEGLILITLYNLENGILSTEMKKTIMALNPDIDELEEGLESLREEAYIRYEKERRRWHITDDGKAFLEGIATFDKPSINFGKSSKEC